MQQGFVKVAAVTPDIRVADPVYNGESVLKKIREAADNGAVVIVCPELCLTGYTCNDLFLQETLLREAKEAGCTCIGGKGMLLWQGVAAFKLYTGMDMPVEEVKEKFFS